MSSNAEALDFLRRIVEKAEAGEINIVTYASEIGVSYPAGRKQSYLEPKPDGRGYFGLYYETPGEGTPAGMKPQKMLQKRMFD
jgi:hypothetical protein